jgi:hypothetical protein
MIKKISNLILIFIFIIIMIFLTLSARGIHNARIPNVTVQRLTREEFEITRVTSDGFVHTFTQRLLAIPKDLYYSGEIFIITPIIINGERRDAARRVTVTTGEGTNENFYSVVQGIDFNHMVIIQSDRDVVHNGEVFVVPR